MYRKLALVFIAVIFKDSVLAQIFITLFTSIIFMLYLIEFKPMINTFSNVVVILHEFAIYLCTLLTLVYSDVITSSLIRYKVANVWVIIIGITLVIDTVASFLSLVLRSKKTLEIFAIKCRADMRRRRLLKEGKLKIEVELTPYQKQILAYKN